MPQRNPGPALVLFDIDGTLIRRAGPHHRQALVDAIRIETGLETTTDQIPVQGMLDRDILKLMLARAGVSGTRVRRVLPAVMRQAQLIYQDLCPDLKRKTCPGARWALRRLRDRAVIVGLVTGNLSGIAWKKMQHAGIREFFGFGAFAEMAHSRAGLVSIAVRQARREGWINGSARISLIGDHPNDIEAARLNRVRSIAVCTGIATREELAACGPDLLLPDLRSLRMDMVL